MNRFEHLQKTLPQNIADNADYPKVEFVVLDYNSTDGLEDWMRQNLSNWQGKVVYYKTLQPQSYARSHSRNMVFRLASGDILCNIDADNFVGKGFAHYVNRIFEKSKNIYMEAYRENFQDVFGKVCFKKSDFETIQGYDEKIVNYGFEDIDFKNRLKKNNLKQVLFKQKKFLRVITHGDVERVRNESFYKNLEKLLVQKISPSRSKLIFVFNDLTFESAEIIDNLYTQVGNEDIKLLDKLERFTIPKKSIIKGNFGSINTDLYEKINDENQKMSVIHFYSQLINKAILTENKLNKIISVNQLGYGKGVVYRNFDYLNPIQL